ncbi:DMT family transporter [Soonwooa sp.]|uniref:DMT family transporter n=1 Tax=Soonwooa sp. TaxID=1938592 RepID=UPI0028A9BC78|nr:DMT family transporter [Soonwooa sp.]
MKTQGYILAAISAISYGLIPIFILPMKQINFSMDVTLFYRFLFSAIMVGVYLVFKKVNLKINKGELLVLLILGLFYALSSEFLFLGYDYLSAGIASTVLFVYPVLVALVMFLFYGEKLSKMGIVSLLLTFLGVIVLCLKGNSLEINFVGLGIVLLSALFYGLYIIIVNKAKINVSGIKLSFYSMLFTSIYFLMKSLVLKESLTIPSYSIFFNFVTFAFVTTLISSVALVLAIQKIGSTPTAIMGALEPVIAVAVSVLFFNEDFTRNLLIGIVLILIGVSLNMSSSPKTIK